MVTERQQYNNEESDEISLKELLLKIGEWGKYLLSKWIIILCFGLLGGALGFAYSLNKKPVYTAITTFVLEDEKAGSGAGGLAGLASIAGVDIGGGGGGIFQGDNILSLYKSRMMLTQTLLSPISVNGQSQLLIDRYIAINKLRTNWETKPELNSLQFKVYSSETPPNRLRDSILGGVIIDLNTNYLSVAKPDKKLSTIQVDVKSKDEIFAKAFNDALVKNVNEFYVNTKTKKNLNTLQILQHQADSVRAVMNGAIFNAVAVADATPNLNPTRQIQRVAPAQRSQFSAETNKAVLNEMVRNLELTKMNLLKETPLIQVIDQPIYPLKKEKLGKLKAMIVGGMLSGFIICAFLILQRLFRLIFT